jgi:sulfur relay (sulfurtransferase) DsrF/TusC family protein
MRVLQIIEPAHRATLEEQDDTVLWFTRAIRAAGAAADVLFVGTAVCYAARGQACPGLQVGAWSQRHPPAIEQEIVKLIDSGAQVLALAEDLSDRGIGPESMIPGIGVMKRQQLGALLGLYDRVWKW